MPHTLEHHVCSAADEWHTLCGSGATMSFAQSWTYAHTLAADHGAGCECLVLTRGGTPVACAAVRIKHIPLLPLALSYISRGPVVLEEGADIPYAEIASQVGWACLSRHAGLVRIAPPILGQTPPEPWPPPGQWEISEQTYFTNMLDIDRPADDIRKALKQKWRNSLNAAERKGATIELSEAPEAVDRFAPMYQAVAARKGFSSALGPEFYSRVQHAADGADRLSCFFAQHNGNDVAGIVTWMRGGTATYILGASTREALPLNAGYLLQWAAIRHAQQLGCHTYDLGGIDPEGNPDVYRFKSRMGGTDLRSPPTIECASGTLAGVVIRAMERLHTRLKGNKDSREPTRFPA